jgi:mono/diheme cytochrome c family protein
MSDEDLGAVLAYIKSLPPVDNELPARSLHPLLYILGTLGMLGDLPVEVIDHEASHPASVAPSTGAAYGEYLTHLATCYDCHGPTLDGTNVGGPPSDVPPPNITGSGEVGGWTREQFLTAMHTGVTPSGRTLSDAMPWKLFGQMPDDDLTAIYNYLQSLPE